MSQTFQVVFGLTADPIHLGHEQVIINSVQYMQEQGFGIEKFLLVPVYSPNLIVDKKAPKANFQQRFEMCELVAKRLSKQLNVEIVVSEIEKQLSQKSGKNNYSFDTLKDLNLSNGLFIASADHFKGRWPKFRKWYNWQELVQKSGLLINQRPGHSINRSFIQLLKQINPNILIVKNKKSVNTSSTYVRNHFSKSAQMPHHLSNDIISYLAKHNIYTNNS
jgi:nicotinate (nicotinamide) nucleotide adenylyltransferase